MSDYMNRQWPRITNVESTCVKRMFQRPTTFGKIPVLHPGITIDVQFSVSFPLRPNAFLRQDKSHRNEPESLSKFRICPKYASRAQHSRNLTPKEGQGENMVVKAISIHYQISINTHGCEYRTESRYGLTQHYWVHLAPSICRLPHQTDRIATKTTPTLAAPNDFKRGDPLFATSNGDTTKAS
ncbi:hypothetical protein SERLA73DRAFT_157072 [Serpula lacrymans var. lacrymans S7.3]|uniref:Uncharacterized protein n=1 Tax=Serpula lacrymans var. lacrymans (strain S7.3) TaxID=936435 RepID=F8QH95_SERL3|nr:hypothetical protein SERLA73DRAFT_157072 [Serpula lacrymans var. lacrymans S7.3]